jgi:hypothetical protein
MNSLMFSKIFPIQYKSCENIGDLCVLLHWYQLKTYTQFISRYALAHDHGWEGQI